MDGLTDEPINHAASVLAEDPERAAYELLVQHHLSDLDRVRLASLTTLALVREVKGLRRDLKARRAAPVMKEKRP